MIEKYYKVDGLSTVLKLEILPDRARVLEWTGNGWVKTGNKYVGIFVDEIPTEEIEKGSTEWTSLGLHE